MRDGARGNGEKEGRSERKRARGRESKAGRKREGESGESATVDQKALRGTWSSLINRSVLSVADPCISASNFPITSHAL
eukprot:2207329-Rhodomonas_salina.2